MNIREKLAKIREETSDDVKFMINHSFAIVDRIEEIMTKKKINQRQLADMLGKEESEVSRWMRGTHNFTIKTIAKLEAALGEPIFSVSTSSPSIYVFDFNNGPSTIRLAIKGVNCKLNLEPRDFHEDNAIDISQLCDQLN